MAMVKRWLVAVYSPGHMLSDTEKNIVTTDYIVFGGGTKEWLRLHSYSDWQDAVVASRKTRGRSHPLDFVFDIDIPEELLVE